MKQLCYGALLVLGLVTTAPAQPASKAPPPKPAPQAAPQSDPKVEARKLFDQATEQYKVGKFAEALVGYEAAYALFKAPAFLFNIAQCHFQLQNWDRAVFFFQSYLREQPEAANRALVEDLMREAHDRQKAKGDAEQRRLDLEKSRLELEQKQSEQLNKELELQTLSLAAKPEPPLYKKWWFWTIVGGVAAATVTTTVMYTTRDSVLPSGSLGTVDQR